MSIDASVHQAFADLETRLASSRASAALSIRLLKLVSDVVDHWQTGDYLDTTASMTDSELLATFAVSGAVTGALDTRQSRALARRAEARIQFLSDLKESGGLLKASQVSKILGVSRQTVNNHITLGKLIAIKEGNDYLIPGFQFTDNQTVEHLNEVSMLINKASAEAKCTFLFSPIQLEGGPPATPLEILKRGATDAELLQIRREASLFLGDDNATA